MPDIENWIRTAGKGLLLIYGSNDPWSAAAVDLGAATDSYKFFVAGGNHGSGLGQLAAADLDKATAALRAWSGLSKLKAPPHHHQAPRLRHRGHRPSW